MTVHAAPAISIGSMFEFLDSDRSTLLKRVRNNGVSTAFVKVAVSEVKYDAHGRPTEHAVDSAAVGGARGHGMVASPARLIVPAHGMQASRLLFRGERDVERYYRVRFMPVVPDKSDDFAITETEREQYREAMSVGVNVLAGYGAFVIVRPKHVQYETQVTSGDNEFTVANRGNSTIVLDALHHCDAGGEQCTRPMVHYVLPGAKKAFPKIAGRRYMSQLIEGKHKRDVRLDQ
ncbi:hypothetical protein [Burkholderia lata]|uniref:hypothetical protein n=1 Tax=Burkholderia lata (strain ATCC 17760 / DSM 23089 / LMG 22485 / NCIMB 9086 / R18194 / 383) TaxID=482957 RepID=UPI00399AFEC1